MRPITSALSIFLLLIHFASHAQVKTWKIHIDNIESIEGYTDITKLSQTREDEPTWYTGRSEQNEIIISAMPGKDSAIVVEVDAIERTANEDWNRSSTLAFHDGLFPVRIGDQYGIYSAYFHKMVVPATLDSIVFDLSQPRVPYTWLSIYKGDENALIPVLGRRLSESYFSDSIIFSSNTSPFFPCMYMGYNTATYNLDGKLGMYAYIKEHPDSLVTCKRLIPPLYDTIAKAGNGMFVVGRDDKFGAYIFSAEKYNTNGDFHFDALEGDSCYLQQFTGLIYDKMECVKLASDLQPTFCVVEENHRPDLLFLTPLDEKNQPIYLTPANYDEFAKKTSSDSLAGPFGTGAGYPFPEWYCVDRGAQSPSQKRLTSVLKIDVDSVFWDYSDTLRSTLEAYRQMGEEEYYEFHSPCQRLEDVSKLYIAKDGKFRRYPLDEVPVLSESESFPILFKGYEHKKLDSQGISIGVVDDYYTLYLSPTEDERHPEISEELLIDYFPGTESIEWFHYEDGYDYYIFKGGPNRIVAIDNAGWMSSSPNFDSAIISAPIEEIQSLEQKKALKNLLD